MKDLEYDVRVIFHIIRHHRCGAANQQHVPRLCQKSQCEKIFYEMLNEKGEGPPFCSSRAHLSGQKFPASWTVDGFRAHWRHCADGANAPKQSNGIAVRQLASNILK